MADIFTPDEGDPITTTVDAEGGPFRRAEDELAVIDDANKQTVSEALDVVFEGMEMTPEFRQKLAVVFEAATTEVVKECLAKQADKHAKEVAALKEAHEAELVEANQEFDRIVEEASAVYESRMQEEAAATVAELKESLQDTLDYTISEWKAENAVQMESAIKVQMAESLMSGLRSLFEAHNIDISEETIDTVAGLEEELAQSRARTNEIMAENIRLSKTNKTLMAESAFREVAEGLTKVQADKLRDLTESLDVEDLAKYKTNVLSLRESFIRDSAPQAERPAVETFVESTQPAAPSVMNEHHDIAELAKLIKNKWK